MAMLEDLSLYLASKGYGVVGQDIFMDILPEKPAQVIALYGVPGFAAVEHMGGSIPAIEGQRCEVMVRAESHTIAENISRDIWGDLHRLIETSYGTGHYHRVWAMNSPYLYERNNARLWIFTCTYNVLRKVVGS